MSDAANLWCQSETGHITRLKGDLDDIIESLSEQGEEIYVLGSKRHAELLCGLHHGLRHAGGPPLYVGTPLVLTRTASPGPTEAFELMGECDSMASSLGGWHEFTAQDELCYSLRLQDRDVSLECKLKRHPAWPAVSFLPRADRASAAVVLAEILDPRWFVESVDTSRVAMMKAYFGIFPNVARYYLYGTGSQHRNYWRFANLVQFWSKKQYDAEEGCVPDFVRRCCERKEDLLTGLLRASTLCLNLLRGVWLQALTPGHEVFVPQYFFEGEDVLYRDALCASFEKHWRKCNEKRGPVTVPA